MTGVFKHKNPGNALILLFYALVLKLPMFLHPVKPVVNQGDNYLYKKLLQLLEPLTVNANFVFSLLAFLLLFTQATLLNRISNTLKLLPRQNFLAGMAYILATSLLKDWNTFSAPLLVNSVMIFAWYKMTSLYNSSKPKTAIFNLAVLTGILPLVYSPAVAFLILLLLAVLITRPFRITEILVAILGFLTPYYFLFVILYLTNQWSVSKIIPDITFHLPRLPANLWLTAGIALLVIPFLSGGYFVQNNLNKLLIQVRKAWSLVLLYMMVSLLIIVSNPGNNYLHWLLVVVPLALFHSANWYYITNRVVAAVMHWMIFAFAILLNYTT